MYHEHLDVLSEAAEHHLSHLERKVIMNLGPPYSFRGAVQNFE